MLAKKMNKSIILSAVIISCAILLNGYFERNSEPSPSNPISKKVIETSVLQSFEYAFHALEGENIIMGKEREVECVKIEDVRYSQDYKKMIVDFRLLCSDGDSISSGIGLNRDEFGIYRGVWNFGSKKAHFEIKKES